MIGVYGEVYPIKAEKFHSYYKLSDEMMDVSNDIYTPTVKNVTTGEVKELLPLMESCIAYTDAPIYAEELKRNVKIFADLNPDGYMLGKVGDYLSIKCDDIHDVYINQKDIFVNTYEEY
jgi:phosphoglycolate phosphatase